MPDPNNCLIKEYNLCFQFICKAGNTSVKNLLVNYFCQKNERNKIFARPEKKWKFCSKEKIPNNYITIGFCRHPESRILSCWKDKVWKQQDNFVAFKKHKIYKKDSFEKFINTVCNISDKNADQHFRSQTYDLNFSKINKLVKIETINQDWEEVRKLIKKERGILLPILKNLNHTPKSQINISEEVRKKIQNRYASDYEILNYK